MKTLVAVISLALVAIAAPASAQGTGFSLEATSAGAVPFEGSGEFGFTLTIGCIDLLQGSGESVIVDVKDPPAWLTVTPWEEDVSAAGCAGGGGSVTQDGTVPFTVSAAAPGVSSQTVKLQATMGSATSNEASATYSVAYNSNYTLTPAVQFPLTVTNKTTTFTVTGVQASNAMSMIMVDDFTASNGALVSGIGPLQYENEAGSPDTKTYTVTFTAPSGEWQSANVTLKVYGHYNFDGMAGDPTDQKTLTWQFVNGGVKDDTKGGGGSKGSPAPVGVLTALGLVALAGLARRRSD